MSVSGALETMSLPEILQWLQYSRKTGTVMFEFRSIIKRIYVEDGLVVSASSNDPREYLGQILVCFGLLTERTLTEAFQQQKATKRLLGKVLIEDFNIEEKKIIESLRIKIEETIYDIFLWENGKFVYTEGLHGLSDHDRLDAAISIDHVIFEGARRIDEWKEFRKKFPGDGVIFRRNPEKELHPNLARDTILKIVYDNIDGKRNMQRILLETHAPVYRGYEAFGKMYWGQFILTDSDTSEAPQAPELDLQTDLVRAAELFKGKKYDEAYDLLEAFLASQPNNQEAQTLFCAVQAAFMESLYKVALPTSVPELKIDFSELNEQVYSSKEGYLASRINGEWDVKSLVMISPLGELESLRILKRLYDGGMIGFKQKSA